MLLAADSLWKIIVRKRAEEQLREHVRALEEADRQKDRFLAMLAHELRNPLAPISNALGVLESSQVDREVADDARKTIRRQVDLLTRLVDDLLDVSRITQGKIELRRDTMDLGDVIRNAVEISQSLIEARGHELSVRLPEGPVWVVGDLVRLGQAVANLLNNAAKYTPNGGQIRGTVEQQDTEVVLQVEDTGVGISAEMLALVFDQFVQVDQSLDRSQGGLGLGLTLVRKLVELHGGTVEALSDGLNQGSRFIIRLPVAAERKISQLGLGSERIKAPGPGRRRILIVDDNKDAASMLGALLEALGHEIRVAKDGPSALKAVRSLMPNVVLLDIGLPEMDGYEVARRIREKHGGDGMLLVALTGYGHDGAIRRSKEAGFDHHLVKPLNVESLLELLAAKAT